MSEVSEPPCPSISLDEAAENAVAVMESRASWRHDPDESWRDPLSVGLAFGRPPFSGFVSIGVPSSSADVDAALTLPTGDAAPGFEAITDEQLAGIGDRAVGFSIRRVIHEDHPRGTRQRTWKYAHVSFTRCGVVVNVMADSDAEHVVSIARELDGWLSRQGPDRE